MTPQQISVERIFWAGCIVLAALAAAAPLLGTAPIAAILLCLSLACCGFAMAPRGKVHSGSESAGVVAGAQSGVHSPTNGDQATSAVQTNPQQFSALPANDDRLQLIKQDEFERRMLAADLHDQVLNDLKVIKSKLKKGSNLTPGTVTHLDQMVADAMDEIRDVMAGLFPSELELLGLESALRECLERGSRRSGWEYRFVNKLKSDELSAFDKVEQTMIFRIFQESINNICKHANATTVRAEISRAADSALLIRIADDGVGIDTSAAPTDSRGMKYMQQRAALLKGDLTWSVDGQAKGTTVEFRVPLPEVVK